MEPDEREESHAAAKARLTEELANMPKYHAYCKIMQGEESEQYLVHIAKPSSAIYQAAQVPLSAQQLQRIEWIREHSKQTYGTPVADVKRYIRERLTPSDQPVSSERVEPPEVLPKTRTSRTRRVAKLKG